MTRKVPKSWKNAKVLKGIIKVSLSEKGIVFKFDLNEKKEVSELFKDITKEVKKLKIERKSLQEQKEIILDLLSKRSKTDKDMALIYKATKDIFEVYNEYDSLLREYIEKIFINPELTNDRLSFTHFRTYIDSLGLSWDSDYE